jgi:hypothetical protein
MTPERAFEIIDAYGADSARWPDEARAALLALAASDADVAAAVAQARRLDAVLGGWAGDVAPREFDLAAITRTPQETPAATRKGPLPLRWITGGALAAAVAAGLIILAPMQRAADPVVASLSPEKSAPSAAATGKAIGNEADAFASVFTPTPDEEELI